MDVVRCSSCHKKIPKVSFRYHRTKCNINLKRQVEKEIREKRENFSLYDLSHKLDTYRSYIVDMALALNRDGKITDEQLALVTRTSYCPLCGAEKHQQPCEEFQQHNKKLLDFIRNYRMTHHVSPGYREIVDAGLASSTSMVKVAFIRLENLGLLIVTDKQARSYYPADETISYAWEIA